MTTKHHRIYNFDLLRGLAVLTMMLAHSVYFFHSRDNATILQLESFGNVVSFVTFLLVSGAVTSVVYFHHGAGERPMRRAFSRVLVLLVAYYLLVLTLSGADIMRQVGLARIRAVLDILSFRVLPGFTEYFPPFIFYSALIALLPGVFRAASKSFTRVVIVSAVVYLAGWALYRVPVGDLARPWVALLSGAPGMFRFPLLQYLPVFLLGLYWGHRTMVADHLAKKRQLSLALGGLFVLIAGGAWFAATQLGWSLPSIFNRWPPTVPFLSLGLAFAFLMATGFYLVHQFRRLPLLRDLLLMFGQNALGLFWSHIFLLGLYQLAVGRQVSAIGPFLFMFALLILLSLALTTFLPFNFRLALTSIRGSREEQEERLGEEAVFRVSQDVAAEAVIATRGLRRWHKLAITLSAIAVAALVFPATTQEIAVQRQEEGVRKWWSDVYAYRRPVTLRNTEPFVTIKAGTPLAITFDHRRLVEEGKSRADGLDVRLAYWNGDDFVAATSAVTDPNSDRATLRFLAPVDIPGGTAMKYYGLYYGGFVSTDPPSINAATSETLFADTGAEETFPYLADVSQRWNLIGTGEGDTITFHLTTPPPKYTPTVTYQVLETSLSGEMTAAVDNTWEAAIPIGTLEPGAYRVQATVHDGDEVHTSQLTGFYRSYPLYVVWTQDWEGYDVNQAYLDAIESIANQYRLPITHYFNPRIYTTTSISPARAKALTQWVQRRLKGGDDIALHLHMFTDFVEAAGVTVRTEPNWGDGGSGYGVPLAAYTKEEQMQLISHARDLLILNGFGRTDTFRAGGWYANLDTLAALEALGFRADSSARTTYQFGKNRLPGYWNVRPTTEPYYPSRTDQNRSSGRNDFDVLEIPDNGADSYAYSATDMIARFTANYGNGILGDKQQLTYLSHPHWFDAKEQARVRELLAHIRRYGAADDQGPVIFTTTSKIVDLWSDGR